MKNFKVFIILILTFFKIERLRGDVVENDVKQLQSFLQTIQNEENLLSKKVFIDDNQVQVSIRDLFNTLHGPIDSQKITTQNVYVLSHSINIVLSCEYSEITYHYISLIDKRFSQCIIEIQNRSFDVREKLSKLNVCFKQYHLNLIDTIDTHNLMILSLASFAKLTKNTVSKYHKIFKILLSWYTYIDRNIRTMDINERYPQRMTRLDSIIITNFQIKKRLERFLHTNCYSFEKLAEFKEQVDMNVAEFNDKVQYTQFLQTKYGILNCLNNPDFVNTNGKFVMDIAEGNFEKLITLLSNQVLSDTIYVAWKGVYRDIKKVFEIDIKNSINIVPILQYEYIILEIINNIILYYEVNTLSEIVYSEEISDKKEECKILFEKLNDFANRTNDVYQHIIIANNLSITINDVSRMCILLASPSENQTEIDSIISTMKKKLEGSNFLEEEEFDKTKFDPFLCTLSEMIIYAKFHPFISNTLFEQFSAYSIPVVEEFGVDFEYIHTEYKRNPVDNFLCEQTLKSSRQLEGIKKKLKTCFGKNGNIDIQAIKKSSFFTDLQKFYTKIIILIANITTNSAGRYQHYWSKTLLTLMYTMENIILLSQENQEPFIVKNIQHLITFITTMKIVLSEHQYVECSCGTFYGLNNIGFCNDGSRMAYSKSERDQWIKIKNIEDINTINNLKKACFFGGYFESIRQQVKTLFDELNNKVKNVEFKLYWDGTEKGLDEIHTSYTMNIFDANDVFDYISFITKWGIALLYSRLMKNINIAVVKQGIPEDSKMVILAQNIIKISEINLFNNTPAESYLSDFYGLLESLKTYNETMPAKIKDLVRDEFKFLGFVESSLPFLNVSNADNVDSINFEFLTAEIHYLLTNLPTTKPEPKETGSKDLDPNAAGTGGSVLGTIVLLEENPSKDRVAVEKPMKDSVAEVKPSEFKVTGETL